MSAPVLGSTDLDHLLRSMQPTLHPSTFVFATVHQVSFATDAANIEITPQLLPPDLFIQASSVEKEGLTVITTRKCAEAHAEFSIAGGTHGRVECKLEIAGPSRMISLTVHSSLEAVGLTARISSAFAEANLPCNVVAGYFHDHVFVPEGREQEAMGVLGALAKGEKLASAV